MKKNFFIFFTILSFFIIGSILIYLLERNLAPQNNKATTDWWNNEWSYRIPITVNSESFDRVDKPVEVDINFTQIINDLERSGTLNIDSLRLVEINQNGSVINQTVPFQFDKNSSYNQNTNASGKLTFLLTGNTAQNITRQYHLYFGTSDKNYTPATIPSLITTTDNVTHKGFPSIKIQTPNGEYYYHKPGGGFATLLDSSNKDWLGWSTSIGAEGDYRGIPNMVPPSDGGFFHPGRDTSTTVLLSKGPIKTTFSSKSNNNLWEVLWDVYPSYARMTVEKAPVGKKYWFLYEGTPGGKLDLSSDRLTRSDKTSILASEKWESDIPGEEWLFVSDSVINRSIYLIHHQEDSYIDAYYNMTHMTVFGFGRHNMNVYLEETPKQFTIGLANNTSYDQIKTIVYNAYKPVSTRKGRAEFYKDENSLTPPPTATNTPIPTNSLTPTGSLDPTTSITPIPTNSLTPTVGLTPTTSVTPIPTNTGNPVISNTPMPTDIIGNRCGKADTDGDGRFTIEDFVQFALAYGIGKNTCVDKDEDYGPCGGRDVNRDGKLSIQDFGELGIGFAQRYYPKTSCAL